MGLDISKIANEQLKKLAYLKDEDNNSILDEQEYSIFKTEAAEVEGVSADDFNQAIGLFKSEEAKTVTAPEELESKKSHTDKKATERARTITFRYIDNLLGEATRENLIEKLDEHFGTQKDDPRYVEIKADIEAVMALMEDSYESVQDIRKGHNQVLKKMKENGIRDIYHEKILRRLERMAEVEVRDDANKEIATRYEELVSGDGEEAMSNIEAMKQIKAEYKANKNFKQEHRSAYRKFEKTTIMSEANVTVSDIIDENNEDTKKYKVEQQAIKDLKAEGKWNKYTKKSLRGRNYGDQISSYSPYGREKAGNKARENKLAQSQVKSEKEIIKTLGCKSSLYEALVNSGILEADENGNVDLSLLTAIIQGQVGADNLMNRSARIDKAISEKFRTATALALETELKDLSENEAKKLAKLCGIPYEGKDWVKVFLGMAGGAGIGAGIGVTAAGLTKAQEVIVKGGTISNELNINLKVNDPNILNGLEADGATITETATGINISISQLIQVADKAVKLAKNVGSIFWPAAVAGAAVGLLNNLEDRGEIPVTVTQFAEKDYDKYIKRTRLEFERIGAKGYADVINCIAASYLKEDGTWDVEAYKQKLNEIAGDGGKLNKQELLAGCQSIIDETEKDKDETPEVCNAIVTYESTEETSETQDLTKIHERKGGDTWRGLVNAYYPKLVEACNGQMFGSNGAIRELKKALSVNEDGSFNHDTYLKLLNGGDLPKIIKLPLEIKGTKRFDGTVVAERVHGNGRALIDKVGKDEIKVTKIPGTNVYKAVDGCDCEVAPAYGTTVEEAVANLKEKTGKEYKEIITE